MSEQTTYPEGSEDGISKARPPFALHDPGDSFTENWGIVDAAGNYVCEVGLYSARLVLDLLNAGAEPVADPGDTRRLDWLAKVCHRDSTHAIRMLTDDNGAVVWDQYDGLVKLGEGADLRAAIDAALNEEGGKP